MYLLLNLNTILKRYLLFSVMNIIKLGAITSTNDYLKELTAGRYVDNFTIVSAEEQTAGRGQMGTGWSAQPGKNLTFSILIRDLITEIQSIFYLNAAVAVSITAALQQTRIDDISIKWPNDILAGNKKLGGILIENNIRANGEIFSIVGIGLNVNQTDFSGLPKATSIALLTGNAVDKEMILTTTAENLRRNVSALLNNGAELIWESYLGQLYKKNKPMMFEKDDQKFMGIIKGVSKNGNLCVQHEDDRLAEYAVKEIQMLY